MDVRLSEGRLRRHPVAPKAVRWLVETLERAGYETWAVGGAVRDVLLGLDSGDWDFATRARPSDVQRIFRRTVPLGVEHGTVGVLARDGSLYEVTTFRRDVVTTGRHAVVEFADRLEEDLSRRDFTINAIAWHPLRDELYDPFGGAADLEARVLRTVGDPHRRFAEDYLRVLRALRFAGRFGLDIEPRTWEALTAAVPHLDILSRERVREELMKVLGGDPKPSAALELYRASGALARVAPELVIPGETPPPGGLPPDLDAWEYALELVDELPARRPLVRLAALLQVAAHANARATGDGEAAAWHVGQAGEVGAGDVAQEGRTRAAQLMIRLRFSNAQVERVTGLVAAGPLPPEDKGGASLRRWLSRVGAERLPDLTRIWIARERVLERHGVGDTRRLRRLLAALRRELRARPPLTVADLALGGRDLISMGMKPGPRFRTVLGALLDRVLEDPSINTPERLAAIVRDELMEQQAPAKERRGEA